MGRRKYGLDGMTEIPDRSATLESETTMRILGFAALSFLAVAGMAQAQTQGPMTATCKDGTSWSGARRSGACRGHEGVQTFGTATGTPTAATSAATGPAASTPSARSVQAATPAPQTAAGGGAGQVWVNTSSKVYHCPGDRYYGHTKAGQYMSEAAAKAAGDRPDHGKACS